MLKGKQRGGDAPEETLGSSTRVKKATTADEYEYEYEYILALQALIKVKVHNALMGLDALLS